jgi:hypothetical protein
MVLPTPGGRGGEALGVAAGDVNGDGVPEIIVCGFYVDIGSSERQACLWFCDWVDYYLDFVALPPIVPDGDSEALAVAFDASSGQAQASGYSYDSLGNRTAVVWYVNEMGAVATALTDLPDGFDSAARTEMVGLNEAITVGGSVRNPQGVELPALFTRSGGEVTTRLLQLPAGATGGQVNSIIAILIGLLVGGEVNGPQGSSAAIWINQGEIPSASRVYDLNRLASNRPEDVRLRSVNMLLPFIEQDNLYRVAGVATDASGRRHGYVGVVGSDHAWGSHQIGAR